MNDEFDSEDEQEKAGGTVGTQGMGDHPFLFLHYSGSLCNDINSINYLSAEEAGAAQSGLFRPVPVCPVIIQPELDLEVRLF